MNDKGKNNIDSEGLEKGNASNNYCPIACLPLMWKLLTSILAEKVYVHLFEKNVEPDEQMAEGMQERLTRNERPTPD